MVIDEMIKKMISSAVLFKFILVKVRAKRRIIMNKKLLATIIGSATVIGLLPTTVMAANDIVNIG